MYMALALVGKVPLPSTYFTIWSGYTVALIAIG